MSIYKPTWLMIKQHNQTGLKYLCKTTKSDPVKYLGSGKYWKNHLKVHGDDVATLWCHLYLDKAALVSEALSLSTLHNVVESKEWANLKPENGLDGGCGPQSPAAKKKLSLAKLGKKDSPETCANKSRANIGKHSGPRPADMGAKISRARKGVKRGSYKKRDPSLIHGNKGKKRGPLAPSHKESIRIGNTGKPKSHKGKPWSAARRAAQK